MPEQISFLTIVKKHVDRMIQYIRFITEILALRNEWKLF